MLELYHPSISEVYSSKNLSSLLKPSGDMVRNGLCSYTLGKAPYCEFVTSHFTLIQHAFVQHPHSVPGIGLGTGDPKMSEEEIPSLGGGCGIQRTFLEEVIPSRSNT